TQYQRYTMQLQNLIHKWLLGGTDPEVGCRLFLYYCQPSHAIARIISKAPERHIQTIRIALLTKAGLPYNTNLASRIPELCHPEPVEGQVEGRSLRLSKGRTPKVRTDYPFLADPSCPPELKLLISDKITAYRNCAEAYAKLNDCTTPEQQLSVVSKLVTNFIENHDIYRELQHYKKHSKTLGEHPIFAQYQRIRDLRNNNTMDLIKKKKNLEHAIWRNESKIQKENRPDLLPGRQAKIKELKMMLAEVDRLLE